MRIGMLLSILIAAMSLLVATPATSDVYECAYEPDPRKRIRECTLAINAGAFWSYPGPATEYYNRANAYHEINDYGRAIADYSAAIGLGIEDHRIYLNRALAYQHEGVTDRAIADFGRVIELVQPALVSDPANVNAHLIRATALINLGEHERALVDLDAASRLAPEHGGVYLNLGYTHCMLGDAEQSLSGYLKAIELRPEDAGSWMLFLKEHGFYNGPVEAGFGAAAQAGLRAWTEAGCPDA